MSRTIKRIQSNFHQGENYYVSRIEVCAGHSVPPHWHDYFEFEIILDGDGEQIYNGTRYALKRGTVSLMSYYDFHALQIQKELKILKLQFNEQMLSKELNEMLSFSQNRFCFSVSEEELQAMIGWMELIETEDRKRMRFSDCVVRNAISMLVVMLLRRISPLSSLAAPTLLQKAIAHIHTHFRENISLTQVAEYCSVTPNYLGKRFSEWMGTSFSDYLNTVRLRYACQLLSGTDLRVREIAIASGYSSVEHFEYIFKRKLSCTPLDFRKGVQQK
jgi:YesN/AraC family two-component response regulator